MIEIMKPDGADFKAEVIEIINDEGEAQESAPHSKQMLHLKLSEQPEIMDVLRMPVKSS